MLKDDSKRLTMTPVSNSGDRHLLHNSARPITEVTGSDVFPSELAIGSTKFAIKLRENRGVFYLFAVFLCSLQLS